MNRLIFFVQQTPQDRVVHVTVVSLNDYTPHVASYSRREPQREFLSEQAYSANTKVYTFFLIWVDVA